MEFSWNILSQIWKLKRSIFGTFYFFIIGKVKIPFKLEKKYNGKLRSGNFDLKDTPRSGRPVEANEESIKALIDANRRITTREITERLTYRIRSFIII